MKKFPEKNSSCVVSVSPTVVMCSETGYTFDFLDFFEKGNYVVLCRHKFRKKDKRNLMDFYPVKYKTF